MKKSLLAILLILSISCAKDQKNEPQFKVDMTEEQIMKLSEDQMSYLLFVYGQKGIENKFFEKYKKNPYTNSLKINQMFRKGKIQGGLNLLDSLVEKSPKANHLKGVLYLDEKTYIFHEKDIYLSYLHFKKAEELGGFESLPAQIAHFEISQMGLFANTKENVIKRLKVIEEQAEKGVLKALEYLRNYRIQGFLGFQSKDGQSVEKLEYKDDKKLVEICFKILKTMLSVDMTCSQQLRNLTETNDSLKKLISEKFKKHEEFLDQKIAENSVFSASYEMQKASLVHLKLTEELSGKDQVIFVVKKMIPHFLNIFKKHGLNRGFIQAYQVLNPSSPQQKDMLEGLRAEMKPEMNSLLKEFIKNVNQLTPESLFYESYQKSLYHISQDSYLDIENRDEKSINYAYEWFKSEVRSLKPLAPPSQRFRGKSLGIYPTRSLRLTVASDSLNEKQKTDIYKKMYQFLKDEIAKEKEPHMLSQLKFNELEFFEAKIHFPFLREASDSKENLEKSLIKVYEEAYLTQKGAQNLIHMNESLKENLERMYPRVMSLLDKKIKTAKTAYLKGKFLHEKGFKNLIRHIIEEKPVDLKQVFNDLNLSAENGYFLSFFNLTGFYNQILKINQIVPGKYDNILVELDKVIKKVLAHAHSLEIEYFLQIRQ